MKTYTATEIFSSDPKLLNEAIAWIEKKFIIQEKPDGVVYCNGGVVVKQILKFLCWNFKVDPATLSNR